MTPFKLHNHLLPWPGAARIPVGLSALLLLAVILFSVQRGGGAAQARAIVQPDPLPQLLSETGLFADGEMQTLRSDVLPFSVQYPLWTDGATKRRWISLPAGTWIDASNPDQWRFPAGTRFWKEFSFAGQPIETRYIEHLGRGQYRYATYLWRDDGSDAVLAPARGVPDGVPVDAAVGRHRVPAEDDCITCHEGQPTPILGFSLLQLSTDRDPNALHTSPPTLGELDLALLLERRLLRGLPRSQRVRPPRIEAASPTERTALGYLHGNCGGCHNKRGPLAPLGLFLAQSSAEPELTLASLVDQPSRFRTVTQPDAVLRVAPGDPDNSMVAVRLASSNPHIRMPALGTGLVDEQAVSLIRRWISETAPSTDGPSVSYARSTP